MTELFSKELKKFSSIIGKPLYLSDMEKNSLIKLIDKRFKINEKLKIKLIEDKDNLRDIINIINIFKSENLKKEKDIIEYFNLFEFNSYELEIMKLLLEKPMSIKEIGQSLNKTYNTVNKRIKSLRIKQAINKKGNICFIQFEAYCSLLNII